MPQNFLGFDSGPQARNNKIIYINVMLNIFEPKNCPVCDDKIHYYDFPIQNREARYGLCGNCKLHYSFYLEKNIFKCTEAHKGFLAYKAVSLKGKTAEIKFKYQGQFVKRFASYEELCKFRKKFFLLQN